jgi:integrase
MSTTKRRGHVRQRGQTFTAYWRARDEKGQSVQRSKGGFATADAADRHLTKVLRDLDTGNYVEPDRKKRAQTLAMFVRDDWLPAIRGTVRSSTFESYQSNLELHVLPTLGGNRLSEITPERLNALYGNLLAAGFRKGKADEEPRGLSPRTVRYVHTIVQRALKDAVLWDRIARNPAERATPPEQVRGERAVWSSSQLREFIDHVRDDRLFAAWLLACTTGMRRGEVLGLRWSDVDLEAGKVTVQQALVAIGYRVEVSKPKTDKSRRRIGLDPATVAALRSWKVRQSEERLAWGPAWTDSGFVFTREDGTALHPQSFSQTFERHVRDAKLPTIRLHDVRHSYATAALNAGVATKVLSERLGHSSIAITSDVYQHVLPEIDDQAAATVAAAILG